MSVGHNNMFVILLFPEESPKEDNISDIDIYGDLQLDLNQQIPYDEVFLVLVLK